MYCRMCWIFGVWKFHSCSQNLWHHNDKEPDQAACTAAVVRKWLWSKHVCKMCVCHCLLLVLCFHTWSVSHLRSSRLRWWRRSHVVHWHRPSGTSLPRLLSRLNCHVPSYKSPGKFIVLKMKTKKVTHTKKSILMYTPPIWWAQVCA